MARPKLPSWLPQVLGCAISVVCLAWVLHDFDLAKLKNDFDALEWKWVAAGIAADLMVYVVGGWRWQTLLTPVARLGFWRTVQAIYIGLFANEVVPLRVGELIRCYLLTHWNNLRLSLGFASAAVERIIDGFWLLAAFEVMTALVQGIPDKMIVPVRGLEAVLVIGTIAAVWTVKRKREPEHVAEVQGRTSATFRHVVEGLQLMGRQRTLISTVLISGLYFALQVFVVYALLKAFKTDYSFWVAAVVQIYIKLWTLVPGAPANIGIMNAATVEALKLFDLPIVHATNFSFILWGFQTLPLLIGGAVATALTGVNLKEIRERAKRSAEAH